MISHLFTRYGEPIPGGSTRVWTLPWVGTFQSTDGTDGTVLQRLPIKF